MPAKYLTKPDLVQEISALIAEHDLPAEYLRLEMTESGIMEDPESASIALAHLSELGVKTHIDDFGTGYSSLNYLANLPVHALKIDRDFVSQLDLDERKSMIVRSVVALAHNLGLKVIAEGVETPRQLDYLKALKCQYGQGYLFSTPLDSEKATEFIKEWSGLGDGKKLVIANLRAFELFQGLDENVLAEVANICEEKTVPAGDVVIQQNQVGDTVYLMMEGSAAIYRGEGVPSHLLTVLQAPTVFGEMAILNQGHLRSANVKALSDLRLLAIPIPLLDPLLRTFPRLRENLQNLVAGRLLG